MLSFLCAQGMWSALCPEKSSRCNSNVIKSRSSKVGPGSNTIQGKI